MPSPVFAARTGSEMTLFRFGFDLTDVLRLTIGDEAVAIVGEVLVVVGDENVE